MGSEHFRQQCSCPSRSTQFAGGGRLEPSTVDDRNALLNMIDKHLNSHPLIPDRAGVNIPSPEIYRRTVSELYQYCRSRAWYRTWSYLWVNWYRQQEWKPWARSTNEHEIPILRTPMILESHWRVIKHDFLDRLKRPRIDLVVWVLDKQAF